MNNKTTYDRVIFSLPRPLVAKLKKYSRVCRGGNKSGFVADALDSYINALQQSRHAARLRTSYTAARRESQAIMDDFAHIDEETWSQIDKLDKNK